MAGQIILILNNRGDNLKTETIAIIAIRSNVLFIPAFVWVWRSEGRLNKLETKAEGFEKEREELKDEVAKKMEDVNDNLNKLFKKLDDLKDDLHLIDNKNIRIYYENLKKGEKVG